jgi:hypothetical protein
MVNLGRVGLSRSRSGGNGRGHPEVESGVFRETRMGMTFEVPLAVVFTLQPDLEVSTLRASTDARSARPAGGTSSIPLAASQLPGDDRAAGHRPGTRGPCPGDRDEEQHRRR